MHTRAASTPTNACLALAVIAAIAFTGCAPRYENLKGFLQGDQRELAAGTYRLQPPDVVGISSPTAPELDGDVQPIRSDGKLTLRLIGEVQAAGLTPRELAARIEESLAHYYETPSVSVRVVSFESQKIYVFGMVTRTGALPFTGRDTVLDVLAQAQPNRAAWGAMVKVIRPSADPEGRKELVVDVDRIMQTGDTRDNFLLQEGDIVYVPPTPLAWAGLALQEVLFPFSSAASAYSTPATFIAATDYYQDRSTGQTYLRLSPSTVNPYGTAKSP